MAERKSTKTARSFLDKNDENNTVGSQQILLSQDRVALFYMKPSAQKEWIELSNNFEEDLKKIIEANFPDDDQQHYKQMNKNPPPLLHYAKILRIDKRIIFTEEVMKSQNGVLYTIFNLIGIYSGKLFHNDKGKTWDNIVKRFSK
jgi:hypothetical protein